MDRMQKKKQEGEQIEEVEDWRTVGALLVRGDERG